MHGDNEQNVVIEELHNHRILVILTATPDFRIVVNERLISSIGCNEQDSSLVTSLKPILFKQRSYIARYVWLFCQQVYCQIDVQLISQEYLAQKNGFQPPGPLCQAMPNVWHLKSTKKGHFRFFAQLDMKCASKWVACPTKCAWEMAGHTDAVIRESPEAKTGQTAKLSKAIQSNS